MSIFSGIGHFFEELFGTSGGVFQKVLTEVSNLTKAALPYVEELSTEIGDIAGLAPGDVLGKVETWLQRRISDAGKIEQFVQANSGAPIASALHNAVSFVLNEVHGAGATLLKDADLAVQLAYNVFAAQHPAQTGGMTVAAVVTKPKA